MIVVISRLYYNKGIDLLVDAFSRIAVRDRRYRLLVAGEPIKEAQHLWSQVQKAIDQGPVRGQVIQHIEFIGDSEIELYFKGADVLVLPYTEIFQSGVLFMAYRFGLPVIATDVGSFGRDIIPGITGYICRPNDPVDLARVIEMYFESDLFKTLDAQRFNISNSIQASHSWHIAADKTGEVYAQLLGNNALRFSA